MAHALAMSNKTTHEIRTFLYTHKTELKGNKEAWEKGIMRKSLCCLTVTCFEF